MGQLQCDVALHQPVGAFGEPDRAHATDAERPHQAVRTNAFARCVRVVDAFVRGTRAQLRQRMQQRAGFDLRGAPEQIAQGVFQIGVLGRQRVDPGGAARRRQVERVVE